jgi:hypothetical protein
MFSRGVYTPQEPAAGGANSTPAPVQDYVLSSTPIPPTAAKAGDLATFDLARSSIGRLRRDVKGQYGETLKCSVPGRLRARAATTGNVASRSRRTCGARRQHCVAEATRVRRSRATLRRGADARAALTGNVASRRRRTCGAHGQHCVAEATHVCHQRAALRHDTGELGRLAAFDDRHPAACKRGRDARAPRDYTLLSYVYKPPLTFNTVPVM